MKKIKAKFKWVRISPLKLRRIVNLVRGRDCNYSLETLRSLPHKGARIVEKIIKSAVASAKNNHHLDPDNLRVVEIAADCAGMLKRYRAKARGRAGTIKKRMSHLSVAVSPAEPPAAVREEEL